MNDEEKEVVYPTVTEEAKSYSDQIMSGFNLEEQMRTGQPPANSEVLPTGETTDTTATGEPLPTGEGEQKVEQQTEKPTLLGEKFEASWQENNKFNAKNPLTWSQIPSAMGAGVTDFGIDLANKIPNVAIPKLPRYEDETLNFVRDLSAFIIPQLYLSKYFKGKANMAHSKVKWKLGDGTFARFFGNAGVDAGVSVLVDGVNERSETDDNLAGTLKKSWPKTYGWIPDNVATLDEDSPDQKRIKNINEGIGLGFTSDFLLGANKLIRALKGVDEATGWIPKSEEARNFLKNKKKKFGNASPDIGEDAMIVNDAQRVQELDDIGRYNLSKTDNVNQPIKGVHDIYDDYEVGYRSADDKGLLGAEFDSYRIANNIDTVHGRVGSVFTPGAMKNSLDLDDLGAKKLSAISKRIKQVDIDFKGTKGQYIKKADVVKHGEDLAAALYDFDSVDEMKRVLNAEYFKGIDADTGIRTLSSEGVVGVVKAISKYFDDYLNMDMAKAQAFVRESLSGQISDLAEGSRYMQGTAAVKHAKEQILDRLEYLMRQQAMTKYVRGRALSMLNWKQKLGLFFTKSDKKNKLFDEAIELINREKELTAGQLKQIKDETRRTINLIQELDHTKPHMLEPLMMAYEVTDGNVKTISQLNNWVKGSTSDWTRLIYDKSPDMPSVLTQAIWGNIYNSVLSAFGTPIKAGFSNMVLMIERPLATFAGAMKNPEIMRRAQYMYTVGMVDTLQQATKHMGVVFRQAWKDLSSVNYIMRSDIAVKNDRTMKALRKFADAKMMEGYEGPSAMLHRIEALNDLAEHPVLRFSANAMTAFDGFTRLFIGSVEARGLAYDSLKKGKGPISERQLKAISKGIYDEMFDDTGMITDKAVQNSSKEIAMNMDMPVVDGMNELLRHVPALKPFMMFPRTAVNMLAYTGSHNPIGLFAKGLNDFKYAFDDPRTSQSSVIDLLSAKGIDTSKVDIRAAYDTIRSEHLGRKAIGTISVMSAIGLMTSDRLHGNGHYDKTVQRTRRELGWTPRSYKGWDGKWYSYEGLGAISDWIAFTSDVIDNFDTLENNKDLEVILNKAGFLLSANLTNKSFLAGLEPMFDIFAGNPAAIGRWTSSFGSGLLPGSGIRNEMARLFTPQMKELEQEFTSLMSNRNVISKDGLPDRYDWIDGGQVRMPETFMGRLWNTYMPAFKSSGRMGPEKQFLIDIGFDGRPQLNTNGRGIEYSPAERSAITNLMGKDGYFKAEVAKIMKSDAGRNFIKEYKEARASGADVDRKDYGTVHTLINNALRKAQQLAASRIAQKGKVEQKSNLNEQIKQATLERDTDAILRLQNMANSL